MCSFQAMCDEQRKKTKKEKKKERKKIKKTEIFMFGFLELDKG